MVSVGDRVTVEILIPTYEEDEEEQTGEDVEYLSYKQFGGGLLGILSHLYGIIIMVKAVGINIHIIMLV